MLSVLLLNVDSNPWERHYDSDFIDKKVDSQKGNFTGLLSGAVKIQIQSFIFPNLFFSLHQAPLIASQCIKILLLRKNTVFILRTAIAPQQTPL